MSKPVLTPSLHCYQTVMSFSIKLRIEKNYSYFYYSATDEPVFLSISQSKMPNILRVSVELMCKRYQNVIISDDVLNTHTTKITGRRRVNKFQTAINRYSQ